MKSKTQKDNIREMLEAERFGNADTAWGDFKRKLGDEFLAVKTPKLQMTPAPRAPGVLFRWLAPAFALFVIAAGFTIWHVRQKGAGEAVVVKSVQPGKHSKAQAFHKGDVFKSGRREIRFLQGNAELTQSGGQIIIEATSLVADFRLREKVDMQIRHPLVSVAITGTQFIFDAAAKGGTIRLSEGSLAIEYHAPAAKSERITLKAPAQFSFSEKKFQVAGLNVPGPAADKVLYRYDLASGETFFAHQLTTNSKYHRVDVLGGKEQIIPVETIVRVEATENP